MSAPTPDHLMHPLVDADGHITATGAAFVKRAGEIMDEAVARSAPTPEPDNEFRYCGRGPCAAEDGHEGTCAEASGWDEEIPAGTIDLMAALGRAVEAARKARGESS